MMWKNKKQPIEGKDFALVPNTVDNDQFDCVLLLKPPYEKVLIRINYVKFQTEEYEMQYDYDILSGSPDLENDETFKKYLGDVVLVIIENTLRSQLQLGVR